MKITYKFLLVLFIVIVCFAVHVTFGFFTSFNFFTAQQDIQNGKIQIVEIGELPPNQEAKQLLANTYGFKFYYFGCDLNKSIINGTKYYNLAMIDHLEQKYGAGWWAKFQMQIETIGHFSKQKLSN